MTIEYIEKDITTIEKGVIIQGVNCQGVMGSGVALDIREKWPIVYSKYKELPTGKKMLGRSQLVQISKDPSLFVVNCFTQVFYGRDGRFASPGAIESSIAQCFEWADTFGLDIYTPKIGSGRGGLGWEDEVEPIISKIEKRWDNTNIYVCLWKE